MNSQHTEPDSDQPPASQMEVMATVIAGLSRRLVVARKMAERAMKQDGAVGDAVRTAHVAARDMIDAVRDVVPGTGSAEKLAEKPRTPDRLPPN